VLKRHFAGGSRHVQYYILSTSRVQFRVSSYEYLRRAIASAVQNCRFCCQSQRVHNRIPDSSDPRHFGPRNHARYTSDPVPKCL